MHGNATQSEQEKKRTYEIIIHKSVCEYSAKANYKEGRYRYPIQYSACVHNNIGRQIQVYYTIYDTQLTSTSPAIKRAPVGISFLFIFIQCPLIAFFEPEWRSDSFCAGIDDDGHSSTTSE